MTRTEAIHILDNLKPTNTKSSFDAYVVGNALAMAIEALEQEPCDDAISRQAALELFAQNVDAVRPYSKTWEEVKALHPVSPQQKMGKWNKSMDNYSYFYTCSCCGQRIAKNGFGDDLFSPYCPECGANMQEVD